MTRRGPGVDIAVISTSAGNGFTKFRPHTRGRASALQMRPPPRRCSLNLQRRSLGDVVCTEGTVTPAAVCLLEFTGTALVLKGVVWGVCGPGQGGGIHMYGGGGGGTTSYRGCRHRCRPCGARRPLCSVAVLASLTSLGQTPRSAKHRGTTYSWPSRPRIGSGAFAAALGL